MDSLHSLPQNSHPTTINAHPVNPYSRGDFSQHFNNNSQVSMQHHNNLQSWPVHSHFPPQNASLSQHLYSQNAGVCNAISSQNGAIHPNQHNLAMNSMPYISSQIMQDALRLSAPVGSSPNDEALMVQILYESPLAGQTYKQALESLHGVNNHAASLWKDYYLDHKPRIDRMVLRRAEETDDIAKMPTPPIPSPVYGPPIRSSRPIFSAPMPVKAPQISKPRKTSKSKSRPPIPSTHPTKRATINSLTTHYAPQDLPNLVLPQTHIVVPKPPSRSPTPPTRVVPSARGNKYTEEDKAYFIKFISWHLKCNPELTKAELCAMLAEKAPQHSVISWSGHWHGRHDLADKILAAAQGGLSDSDNHIQQNNLPNVRRPCYKESSASGSASERTSSEGEEDEDSEWESSGVDSAQDVLNMGGSGGPFTAADARAVAKYIANTPEFDTLTYRMKWEPFEAMYPQRSWKAWAEYYRKKEREVNKMARKMRDKQPRISRPSIADQRGRPSWAMARSTGPPKRKTEEKEGMERNKRQKNQYEESDADADGELDDTGHA